MPFVAIAVVIAAALGGGATLAAQNALPGDALWSYKVNVNETIRDTFSASAEAKARVHIDAIEARLAETEQLATEGRLTAKTEASIEANFDTHAKAVARILAELKGAGEFDAAADIAARYQAAIAARTAALAEVQANAPTQSEEALSPLLIKVRATLDHASALSAEASANAAGKTSTGANTNTIEANAGVRVDL